MPSAEKIACPTQTGNTFAINRDSSDAESPLELEARADELEAAALTLRAEAKRLRARVEAPASRPPGATRESDPSHLRRHEYARRCAVSEATVSRWLAAGMPSIPVGTTVRIDPAAADEWRRGRGRVPTTPSTPKRAPNDVDVDGTLAKSGLRFAGGAR